MWKPGNYELFVMGNLGYGPLGAAIIGATVAKVLKRSNIPVLVVPIPDEPA